MSLSNEVKVLRLAQALRLIRDNPSGDVAYVASLALAEAGIADPVERPRPLSAVGIMENDDDLYRELPSAPDECVRTVSGGGIVEHRRSERDVLRTVCAVELSGIVITESLLDGAPVHRCRTCWGS